MSKQANYRFSDEFAALIDETAANLGITKSEVIRRAVRAFAATIDQAEIQRLLDERERIELELDKARGVTTENAHA